jgi:hypothetical protein
MVMSYVKCNKSVEPSKVNTSDHWVSLHRTPHHINVRTHKITTPLNVYNTTSKTGHFKQRKSRVGHAVSQFIQALSYKPEGRRSLDFFIDIILPAALWHVGRLNF